MWPHVHTEEETDISTHFVSQNAGSDHNPSRAKTQILTSRIQTPCNLGITIIIKVHEREK